MLSHFWNPLPFISKNRKPISLWKLKIREAISVLLEQSEKDLQRGLVTVSAGNHAIATAVAAQIFQTTAKVVMLSTSNPGRVKKAQSLGAEVLIAPDGKIAFEMVSDIQKNEGRFFVHPFDSPSTIQGTSTIAVELLDELKSIDYLFTPVGGGGLAAGMKTLHPTLQSFRC